MKYGIDVSNWQPSINYNKVVNNISFAILRVGYGVSYLPTKQKDSSFENHYAGFKGKVPVGVYYYQYANEIGEGAKEAENCLKYLGGKQLDLPIFYDIEDGSVQGLSKDTLTKIAREFVDKIKNSGYKPGIYASKSWLENKLDMTQFEDCIIWAASYGANNGKENDKYKYSGKHDIWQYTSRAYIDGINGNVDMNVMYKDISTDVGIGTAISKEMESSIGTAISKELITVYNVNPIIMTIQQKISTDYNTNIKVDGYYGPETKKALVKALQHELNIQFDKNLVEDGIFGAKTKEACINVKKGATGMITYLIQSMLYCKGYNTNGIDGIFGNGTTSAVRKFQDNQGLSIDGVVGKNTFEKLFT